MFHSRADAQDAVDRLIEAGLPQDSVRLMPGYENDEPIANRAEVHGGFFESLRDFFMPEPDRYSYAEGLTRGGYLVTATDVPESFYQQALDILDRDGAIDLDEQEHSWRGEGWEGYRPAQVSGTASAGMSSASMGSSMAQPYTETTGMGSDRLDTDHEETIPVVEEELRLGKRDVSHGRVRVRSFVREIPVSQDVNLRNETVSIERRPVDRLASAADGLFKDRVIEAEERAEEPVVEKQARVVEEVGLRKDTDTRTETVSETVRKTEVEVEDNRGNIDRTGTRQ
jgi:uncharacterized protein (TIGR02271 family)